MSQRLKRVASPKIGASIELALKKFNTMGPWIAFRKLCDRKWFTRGWIVQELLLPVKQKIFESGARGLIHQRKTVICRRETVRWEVFEALRGFLITHKWDELQQKEFAAKISANITGLYLHRGDLERVPGSEEPIYRRRKAPIRNLVYEFRDQNVTDPRDRIYAFLGLATASNDIEEKDFMANYKSPVATVFTDFATFLLTRNKPRDFPLRLLSACYRPQAPKPERKAGADSLKPTGSSVILGNMPSWVPDWTIWGFKRRFLMFEDILDAGCRFNATLGATAPKRPKIVDNRILIVIGIIIDTIHGIGIEPGKADATDSSGVYDFLREVRDLTDSEILLRGKFFFLTVVRGKSLTGEIQTEHLREMKLSWEDMIKKYNLVPDRYRTLEELDDAWGKTLCADQQGNTPSAMKDPFHAWRELCRLGIYRKKIPEEVNVKSLVDKAELLTKAHRQAIWARVPFITKDDKMIGITLYSVQEGMLCV
jgi:hypothetical protein